MMKFHDFSGDRNAPSTAYQNSIESFGPKCSQADNDSWILSISNENQRKTIKKWVKDNEIGKIPMNFLSRHFWRISWQIFWRILWQIFVDFFRGFQFFHDFSVQTLNSCFYKSFVSFNESKLEDLR